MANSAQFTTSLTTRVFSIDVIRGTIICVMSFAHCTGFAIDAKWLLEKAWRIVVFGLPIMISGFFAECRGVFFTISGMVIGYRTLYGWANQLRTGKAGLVNNLVRTSIIGLVGGAIMWPLMLMFDFLFEINMFISENSINKATTFKYLFDRVPGFMFIGPVSGCMFQIPIVVTIIALLVIPCHKITTCINKKFPQAEKPAATENDEEATSAEAPATEKLQLHHLIFSNYNYTFLAVFGVFAAIVSLIIALLRYPVGLGLYNYIQKWGPPRGYPLDNRNLYANYSRYLKFNWPGLPGNTGFVIPKPDWCVYFFIMLCTEIGGGLMGAFPFMVHFFTGAVIGFSIAMMSNDKNTPIADKKRVFWTINSTYMAVVFLFVLIWMAILPPHIERWEPDRFNYPTWVYTFGITTLWKTVEVHEWHTGPYELWITSLLGMVLVVVTYLCELSDAGRRIQRADDATNGVYDLSKKGKRAPLRWIRRFSTFSATAICFDGMTAVPMMRLSRLIPKVIPYNPATGKYISWSIYLAYIMTLLVVLVMVILDLVFRGYLSTDYAITLAKSLVSAVITTLIAVSKLASPKVRADIPAWRAALMADLTRIYRSAARPITRQHAGVQFVQCFREDEKLEPRKSGNVDSVLAEA